MSMTERQKLISENTDKHSEMILAAERWLWQHPQTGYTEWEAQQYLAEKFEALGYELTLAGNIPGFMTDVRTGRPGPTIAIMGEMDALDLATHPEAVNGMAHACGHHGQMAAMLGIAAALKEPHALDGLSGTIRLIIVPAEEMIQLEFREELRQKGIIKYNGGKPEFMRRGFFDDVDLSIMVHGGTDGANVDFSALYGANGCIAKIITYQGKAAHAGGSPHAGINAEYAAALGIQAVNSLRETFRDEDHIRFHPIMKGVNCAVNIIPDELSMESYVRASSLRAIKRENEKINRALTGAALSIGACVHLCDRPGYAPEVHDRKLMELTEECCKVLAGEERVKFYYDGWTTGSSDFGDLTCVMPGIQFYAAGAVGTAHGIDYKVENPYNFCVNSAKAQLFLADALLSNEAVKAKEIIDGYQPEFASIREYLDFMDTLAMDKDAVTYDENGNVTIDFKN